MTRRVTGHYRCRGQIVRRSRSAVASGFLALPRTEPRRGAPIRPRPAARPHRSTRATVAFLTIGYVFAVDHALSNGEEAQLQAFTDALEGLAQRLGGVSVVTASVACQVAFGPPEKMTAWQRRAVNRVLAAYRSGSSSPLHEPPAT